MRKILLRTSAKPRSTSSRERFSTPTWPQQTFAERTANCNELDGKSFFFQLRRRMLNLEEYFRSLENLVKAQVYNPEKRRPWSLEDAKQRWEEVKKQAQEDKQKCELVRSLPDLEKRLQELEQKLPRRPTSPNTRMSAPRLRNNPGGISLPLHSRLQDLVRGEGMVRWRP